MPAHVMPTIYTASRARHAEILALRLLDRAMRTLGAGRRATLHARASRLYDFVRRFRVAGASPRMFGA